MAWMCNVLKHYHIMIGPYEEHKAIEPPPKPPSPTAWHFTLPTPLCMGPYGLLTGKPVKNVITAGWGDTMQRGTDIGPLIVHISPTHPLNTLYPLIMIGSASKSEFGVANTKAGNDVVAVAIACKVNFNLNCWGLPRPPLPDGIVITWNTNAVGASLTDLICGVISMVIDSAIQYGINRLFAYGPLNKWLTKINDRIFPNLLLSVTSFTGAMGREAVDVAIPTIVGIILGSPLGISGVNVPQKVFNLSDWLSPGGAFPGVVTNPLEAYQKHVDNPAIEEHPSQPPARPQLAPPAP